MRSLIVSFIVHKRERAHVLQWLKDEWDKYANKKFEETDIGDKWMEETGFSFSGDWQRQITQYWTRANALGLDSPAGRQAMLKSITTLIDCCASMERVYGPPPLPGYASGEIHMRGGV